MNRPPSPGRDPQQQEASADPGNSGRQSLIAYIEGFSVDRAVVNAALWRLSPEQQAQLGDYLERWEGASDEKMEEFTGEIVALLASFELPPSPGSSTRLASPVAWVVLLLATVLAHGSTATAAEAAPRVEKPKCVPAAAKVQALVNMANARGITVVSHDEFERLPGPSMTLAQHDRIAARRPLQPCVRRGHAPRPVRRSRRTVRSSARSGDSGDGDPGGGDAEPPGESLGGLEQYSGASR